MIGLFSGFSPLSKRITSDRLIIAAFFAAFFILLLGFAGASVSHEIVTHVANSHAHLIACGGENLPECG